jgi:hypothetical protein
MHKEIKLIGGQNKLTRDSMIKMSTKYQTPWRIFSLSLFRKSKKEKYLPLSKNGEK